MITKYGLSSCVAFGMAMLFLCVLGVYGYYRLSYLPPVIAQCHIDAQTSFPQSITILQQLLQGSCAARRLSLQRKDDNIRVRVS